MAEERKGAKKSHKHRKHGRQKKKAVRQATRTEGNKVRTLNRERAKAGLPPVNGLTARKLLDSSRIKD